MFLSVIVIKINITHINLLRNLQKQDLVFGLMTELITERSGLMLFKKILTRALLS